ncbi:MAG: beta-ketoacyl-ACP synthase II [Phycisphaerales bacterium]|nr:MAG: beta-ketoacyl-ACP synthase II [Phycisphaerales bacterium]
MTDRRRVVVTGMGAVTALGETTEALWDGVLACDSGVGPVTRFDLTDHTVRIGGECTDFDPGKYIDRKAAKRLDRFAQFAMVAADSAAKDSGLDFQSLDGKTTGVIIGSGIGGLWELEEQHLRLVQKGPKKLSAFTIPKLMVNAATGNISMAYNAQGPSTAVATACASATHAMGDALRAIQHGYAEVVFTGGSEAALTPLGLAAFAAMKALSTRNDDPTHASRPFDRDRDGFVLGEGAGLLIFEELEHAKARGARIYGEVLGFGMSGDASHITQPAEDGTGAALAMTRALENAGLDPEAIDYVNAHGTATILGDIAETIAIKRVFGDHADKLAISSTKSQLGHLLGASGGVELVATLMGLYHNVAPPTANLDEPDPQCDLDYVPHQPRDMRIRRAISNSFGFGGHNATIVVGKLD